MAFFDDLGKKISQAGQSAVQKTKEITEVAKLNGAISDEEKKINYNYYQIGKLYYAMHASDFETDFSGMIEAIKESEQKVVEYRQQIQDIKGVVRCEKCGAEVASNVAFCSSCGAPMPKQTVKENENLIRCSSCGQMVDKDMRFCIYCGANMKNSATSKTTCTNCGAELNKDDAFCTECGTKIERE